MLALIRPIFTLQSLYLHTEVVRNTSYLQYWCQLLRDFVRWTYNIDNIVSYGIQHFIGVRRKIHEVGTWRESICKSMGQHVDPDPTVYSVDAVQICPHLILGEQRRKEICGRNVMTKCTKQKHRIHKTGNNVHQLLWMKYALDLLMFDWPHSTATQTVENGKSSDAPTTRSTSPLLGFEHCSYRHGP